MGSIITLRLILAMASSIISISLSYYLAQPCDKMDYMLGKEETLARYPDCANFYNATRIDQNVVVQADFNGEVDEIGTAMNMNFGMALWVALFLHAFGVEIYVSSVTQSKPSFFRSETGRERLLIIVCFPLSFN